MLLMDKDGGNSAWSGIEILVVAPHRKINVPIVKLEVNIAGRMSTIPANQYALCVCVFCDSLHVEILPSIKLYARK